jgi:hypothetical protein
MHENGSRSSEASQSPTVHEQIVQNRWDIALVSTRSQEQHLNGRQEAPVQPDQSFQKSPPTSNEPSANEHQATSRAVTPVNGFKHILEVGANSVRKRHKTGNEDVPTLYSDTPPAGRSETPCDGNVGPVGRVGQSGGVSSDQAVTACSIDAMVASQSLPSSRRTSNHNSHASSSRLGTGRAAKSLRQGCDEEEEGKSLKNDFFNLLNYTLKPHPIIPTSTIDRNQISC